ncbi:hypothetical protein GCM10023107_37710 [Actinoplanes octamycinicus]|nr:hypothetical protein Aoc01nite_30910 [Actinoplanes octamycinicus]
MAVFPPAAAREDLYRSLPGGARLTRTSKWHVTLAFLGEVETARTPPVASAKDARPASPTKGDMSTAPETTSSDNSATSAASRNDDSPLSSVAEALATVVPPARFQLRLAGGGRFGPVAWAGLAGDVQSLATLRESVRVALDGAGFAIDPRPFRPHLTVSYRQDRALLAALDGYAGPPWPVTGFALVESTLGNYFTRHEWPLPD